MLIYPCLMEIEEEKSKFEQTYINYKNMKCYIIHLIFI